MRLVYASRFLFFFAALFLGILAVSRGSFAEAALAVASGAAMLKAHVWLKRSGKLEECDRALDGMFSGTSDEEDAFEALLQRRATLELRRGQPGFDPWEVQAVRREINDYVRQHPEASYRLNG